MKCPYCGSDGYLKNINTRDVSDGRTRRRRECQNCGERFTTYEVYVPSGENPDPRMFRKMQSGRKGKENGST